MSQEYQVVPANDPVVEPARPGFKKSVIIGGVSLIALGVLAFVVVEITNGVLGWGPMSSGQSWQDCSPRGDFHILGFPGSESPAQMHYVGIRVDAKSERDLFTFEEASEHCQSLNAQIWSVIHGQSEWETVHNYTRLAYPDSGAWLRASFMAECDDTQDECLQVQAKVGQGLDLSWAMDESVSQYSRFVGGNPQFKCLVVSETKPFLWKRVSCTDKYHTLCIRRNCKPRSNLS